MKTRDLDMDSKLVSLLMAEVAEKHLPVHIQIGIPEKTENGNYSSHVILEYADDFDMNSLLCRLINEY